MLRVLGLAMLGVVLTHGGWLVVDRMFSDSAVDLPRLTEQSMLEALRPQSPEVVAPSELRGVLEETKTTQPQFEPFGLTWWGGPLVQAWNWLSEPFVRSVRDGIGWKQAIALALSGFWAIFIWALFGGAIARTAALHLTRGETPGPWAAVKEAFQKWPATAGAPLIPLVGAVGFAIPLFLLGLLLRVDFLAMVVGLLWILVIACGLVLAVVLVGLLAGWPLMWATIGVERTDAFDGVSRCYAYVYQRPLHLAFYVAVALALGWIGQLVVIYFAMAASMLGEWAVSWGAGTERMAAVTGVALPEDKGALAMGASGVWFWKSAWQLFAGSYSLAYLWSAAVGIYLLLRRQVDSTEMDEVTLEEVDRPLPPLEKQPSS